MQFRDDWFRQVDIMQRQMNRLLDHLAGSKPPSVRFCPSAWEPALDVYETEGEIVVTVELAGVNESDIEVLVDQEVLTIRGERKKTPRSGRKAYYLMEIGSGTFCRNIRLPFAVDAENVKATYEAGFVEIVLPKAEARQAEQKIRLSG